MVSNMLSPGLAPGPSIRTGTLGVQSYLPEAMGVEEHLFRALQAIDELRPHHVIVDAISACQRMGTEQAAFEYLMRVLDACKERGITCIYLNQAYRSGRRRRDQRHRHFVHHRYGHLPPPASGRWRDQAPTGRHEVPGLEPFRTVP